ncbi:hypothetical protein [Actibacterium sp. XHP0104]|uniref:hypothetical protein n=1 Tax=Actibacterium sp. XHP0104 TaxID=2984335 RepID=UPI0021E89569|nr:hypothetical protein [Actibacterium sp. XHP0104]MCV2882220.1 hypothetical protein [Actibacterium sp. XHP0104]
MMLGLGFGIHRLALCRRGNGAAPPPPPPPPSFPYQLTLAAWYDPSDLGTLFQDTVGTVPVAADGDPVALMQDKSGNGHHMTQSDPARQPVYRSAGGLHWLETDGADDSMSTPARLGLPGDPSVTISAAIRVLAATNSVERVLYLGTPGNNYTLCASVGTGGFSWRHNNGNAVFGSTVLNTDLVATWLRGAGATYAGGRFWLNDAEQTQTGNSGATRIPTDASQGAHLFAHGNSTNNPARLRFYGMVVTPTDADAQRQTITTHLGGKVGLVL